jgi:hypothetical protein
MYYLHHIDNSPHVASTQPEHCLHSFVGDVQTLRFSNHLDSSFGSVQRNLFEFESCASGLEGRNYFGDVVGDEAKAGIGVVLLND